MRTLQIRDGRAHALAQLLASRRQVTMTEAVIQALESELLREREKEPLAARLKRIASALAAAGKPEASPDDASHLDVAIPEASTHNSSPPGTPAPDASNRNASGADQEASDERRGH